MLQFKIIKINDNSGQKPVRFVEYAEKITWLYFSLLTNMVRMSYLYPKYILYTCIKCIGTIPRAQVYESIQKTIACFRVVSERQTETNH